MSDNLKLNQQNIDSLDEEDLVILHKKALAISQRRQYEKRYFKLKDFKPYDYQQKFYAASADYHQLFLCAGNRVGKTYGVAHVIAYHLTGDYPEWWTGRRFDHPILVWAVGITTDSTRKIMQKALFGTESARDTDELGTGAIPRDAIVFELLERDGVEVKVAKIKHKNGGNSTIEFRSTAQGEHVLMGASVNIIWLDEEDPNKSIEIYSQCVARIADCEGMIIITATPENGITALVDMFMKNKVGGLWFQKAGWNDVTHLTERAKKELLAGVPQWQIPMRMYGEPVLGEGLVFAGIDFRSLLIKPYELPSYYKQVCGVDIGYSHFTTATWSAWDAQTDIITVTNHYRKKGEVPAYHATAINAPGKWIPVVLPHDADNTERGSGSTVAKSYRKAGVNALRDTFYNPPTLTHGKRNNFVMIGVNDIIERAQTNRLWFFDVPQMIPLIEELERYQYKDGKILKKDDDSVDSFRYSGMSVTHRGKSLAEYNRDQLGLYGYDDNEDLEEW